MEPFEPLVDDRQRQMGVLAGRALSGEVLGRGDGAGRLEAFYPGQARAGHGAGVLAEATDADARVLGVIDVEDRGKVHVEPAGAHFEAAHTAQVADAVEIEPAGGHVGGEERTAAADAQDGAALLVGADEERIGRERLELCRQFGEMGGVSEVAAEENHAAEVAFGEEPANGVVGLDADIAVVEELADLVFESGEGEGHGEVVSSQ